MKGKTMKRLLLSVAILITALPAIAGDLSSQGLDDPEVISPATASGNWTGAYLGLSYGRSTSTSESVRCFKLETEYPCDHPIFDTYPEYKRTETTSSTSTSENAGAFAGYRHDFGRVVGGFEVGVHRDWKTAEVQIGVDVGRALTYGLAGISEDGSIYGAGIDVKVGSRLLIGVKHQTGDLGGVTSLRIGVQF